MFLVYTKNLTNLVLSSPCCASLLLTTPVTRLRETSLLRQPIVACMLIKVLANCLGSTALGKEVARCSLSVLGGRSHPGAIGRITWKQNENSGGIWIL